jgi:hypothetical protein
MVDPKHKDERRKGRKEGRKEGTKEGRKTKKNAVYKVLILNWPKQKP